MIEFYGSPMSSAGRTHWMLEEAGVEYQYKKVDTRKRETRTPEFLALYGGGTIPVLRDGALVLGESIAINFYLAEKYKPELMPHDLALRAQAYQWSLWAITNLQPDALLVMFDGMKPKEARGGAEVTAAKERALVLLGFLERSLEGREYLVGGRFSVADINAGSIVNLARVTGLLETLPNTSAWMARLSARPAYQRAAKE